MKVELSSLPAIHLGDECVIPQRTTWDVIVTPAEAAALERVAEAISERRKDLSLKDEEDWRVLARSIEIVQLVARRR